MKLLQITIEPCQSAFQDDVPDVLDSKATVPYVRRPFHTFVGAIHVIEKTSETPHDIDTGDNKNIDVDNPNGPHCLHAPTTIKKSVIEVNGCI